MIMGAVDTLVDLTNTHLYESNLKYCLINEKKRPFKIDGTPARPNAVEDFVDFESLLQCEDLRPYAGIGISIQASNVCAIDVDHCFSSKFDVSSADDRAKDILNRFKDIAYCEFSFSGTGLRVIFRHSILDKYSETWYIKNESNQIEYYQPSNSFRYVTVTGKTIHNNVVRVIDTNVLIGFLNDFMQRPFRKQYDVDTEEVETRTIEQLKKKVKFLYLTDSQFQNLWFGIAPGSGKNESELDYQLIAFLFERITQDKQILKELFESSPYFKSKDFKHINKWKNQDFRYYNYVYNRIKNNHW